MTSKTKEILSETVTEVFESLTFLCPIPSDAPEGGSAAAGGESTFLGISFQGDISGKVWISVPDALRAVVSANMLGIEEEDEEAGKNYDASKELLNVICGNLLTRIYGEEPVFKVNPPYIVTDMQEEIGGTAKSGCVNCSFDIEGSQVSCIFCETVAP